MTDQNPNYRQSAEDESRLADLSEQCATLDKLITVNPDDDKAQEKFFETMRDLGYESKYIDVHKLGRSVLPTACFPLFESVENDLVDIVSQLDLETGRGVTTLYQVPLDQLDYWHARLNSTSGSYRGEDIGLRASSGSLFSALGFSVGMAIAPYVDYVSNLLDLPPMGAAATAAFTVSGFIAGFLVVGQKTGYLAKTKVAQGHAAIKKITRLREKVREPIQPSFIETRVNPVTDESECEPVPVEHEDKPKQREKQT